MARSIFALLRTHEARIFASVVPATVEKPSTLEADDFLRKDLVFLLERYFNFIAPKNETGLLIFDETDASADRNFIRQIERYFTRTQRGRFRANSIVPVRCSWSRDSPGQFKLLTFVSTRLTGDFGSRDEAWMRMYGRKSRMNLDPGF
jgi:hypothetical protein